MKAKQPSRFKWYNRRSAAFALSLAALLLAYPLILRAIDTGNLFIYLAILALLVFALNRLVATLRRKPEQS
jgi:hypothetical protein